MPDSVCRNCDCAEPGQLFMFLGLIGSSPVLCILLDIIAMSYDMLQQKENKQSGKTIEENISNHHRAPSAIENFVDIIQSKETNYDRAYGANSTNRLI